ncbi:hypothetical protein LSAT2_011371 [Lamellibrachia satsuma]|nr:hypothetical protein LSAT2_011371 [Lamellibrachia satsuma]
MFSRCLPTPVLKVGTHRWWWLCGLGSYGRAGEEGHQKAIRTDGHTDKPTDGQTEYQKDRDTQRQRLRIKGSHGGRGGTTHGSFLSSGEAPAYDTFIKPDQPGSGGGGPTGGTGGGVIHIVSNKVTIGGIVSADGTDGQGDSGGGAGGSILIEVTNQGPFNGGGLITAHGGRGAGRGGGGAGGRITVIFKQESSSYSGHLYAYGGIAGDMENIQPPSSITASSTARGSSTYNADLTKNRTRTWRAHYNSNQYLTFNFQQHIYIVAVETKGDQGHFVKSFYLEYYNETAKQFIVYKEKPGDSQPYRFTASSDVQHRIELPHPVLTKQIRLKITDHTGQVAMAAMMYGYKTSTFQ